MEKPQLLLDVFFEHAIKNAVAEHLAMVEATLDKRITDIVDKRIEEYAESHGLDSIATVESMEAYIDEAIDSITVEVRRY